MPAKELHDENLFPLDHLIYGGSFDPVHLGHLNMMRIALERNITQQLDVVPAAVSPLKTETPPVSDEFRIEMLRIGIQEFLPQALSARVRIMDLELRRPPPSYTRDTLQELRAEFPDQKIGLLLGQDNIAELELWKTPEEFLRFHPLVVFRRRADQMELQTAIAALQRKFADCKPRLHVMENPIVECSSSQVRKLIISSSGTKIDSQNTGMENVYLRRYVPAGVRDFIVRHNLYRSEMNE